MTEPSEADRDPKGRRASDFWDPRRRRVSDRAIRCSATLTDVRSNLLTVVIKAECLRFVEVPVEETIPRQAPVQIAVLRLDTDWYESTSHELRHLHPRLVSRGVLLLDGYGHWEEARLAVDEYLATLEAKPLLVRVDYTGRVAVEP
jgi:O-methyltransferase